MLDLHLYQFVYTTDTEQPYYLGIAFNNTEVIVGFTDAADVGDAVGFEVRDKFNGKQLAFVNITHVDMVTAWHDTVTKAHHLVLELHAEAVKQAERDRKWAKLADDLRDCFGTIERYQAILSDVRSATDEDLRHISRAVDAAKIICDALDFIEEPE